MNHRLRPLALALSSTGLIAGLAACQPTTPPPRSADVTIVVTVRDDGALVSGADVSGVTGTSPDAAVIRSAVTGADGRVTLVGPAGRWSVSASGGTEVSPADPLCGWTDSDSTTVTVAAGETRPVVLDLEPGPMHCQ